MGAVFILYRFSYIYYISFIHFYPEPISLPMRSISRTFMWYMWCLFVADQTLNSIFCDWLFNRGVSGIVIFKPGYFDVSSSYSKFIMLGLSKNCIVFLGEVISHLKLSSFRLISEAQAFMYSQTILYQLFILKMLSNSI